MSNLSKLKKSIANEKELVKDKPLAVSDGEEQFDKADKFFLSRETSEHINQPAVNQLNPKVVEVVEVVKMAKSTFSMPKNEFDAISSIMKRLIMHDKIVKQTEIFRIALKILHDTDDQTIIDVYESLPKITAGKPRQQS
jgi:hypothetical protein